MRDDRSALYKDAMKLSRYSAYGAYSLELEAAVLESKVSQNGEDKSLHGDRRVLEARESPEDVLLSELALLLPLLIDWRECSTTSSSSSKAVSPSKKGLATSTLLPNGTVRSVYWLSQRSSTRNEASSAKLVLPEPPGVNKLPVRKEREEGDVETSLSLAAYGGFAFGKIFALLDRWLPEEGLMRGVRGVNFACIGGLEGTTSCGHRQSIPTKFDLKL